MAEKNTVKDINPPIKRKNMPKFVNFHTHKFHASSTGFRIGIVEVGETNTLKEEVMLTRLKNKLMNQKEGRKKQLLNTEAIKTRCRILGSDSMTLISMPLIALDYSLNA